MNRQQLEIQKMLAVRNIMSTFGEDAFSLIRAHIMEEYGVSMDKECPLDILRTVLTEIMSESAADLIIECIFVETDRLCEKFAY